MTRLIESEPLADQTEARPNQSTHLEAITTSTRPGKAPIWIGGILTGLVGAFLLLDAVMKLVKPEPVVKATVQLGYREDVLVGLGIVLTVSTILYLLPRTAVLGAILLTGYLGGAVATHVRVGAGWFEMLFPVVFGIVIWSGLLLRDARLRELLPIRR